MKPPVPGEVTRILRRVAAGQRELLTELMPAVYSELHRLARQHLRGEREGHTLQTTALVNEAFLRLARQDPARWSDRRCFYRAASAAMRYILVNHARDRRRLKRGGGALRVPLEDALAVYEERALDLIALDESLARLEKIDPRAAEIIELRFFGGLTLKETAELLGVSERTVEADWSLARAWLRHELSRE